MHTTGSLMRMEARAIACWLSGLAFIASLLLLQGCATPAASTNMVARMEGAASAPRDASLAGAIAVRNVSGGSDTYPWWMSKVSSADFKTALEDSLKSARLHAGDAAPPRYRLDATLLSLDQPFIGIDLTVTCSAQYDLFETESGKRVFTKTVTTPYTARFAESIIAVERLRIANEGAVRENIQRLLRELFGLESVKAESAAQAR